MVDEINTSYRELAPIFSGSPPQVMVVRALLESHGIESFVPDENIKIVDPFITGANPLEMALVCPADQAAEARRIIEETRDAAPAETPAEERPEDLERLGARVRWAAVTVVTIPIGALHGIRYLSRSRGEPGRPAHHGLTVLAAAFCILVTLGLILAGLNALVR